MVASYFAFEADRGVSPSRIGVLSAAIAAAHEAADFDAPTKTMIARRVQSGIRRTRGGKKARKEALIASDLKKVVQAIPDWRYKDKNSDLAGKHPLAATLLYRAMIDFTLNEARAKRYRHAARHLLECESLAHQITDYGDLAPHKDYLALLRTRHARKSGFWNIVSGKFGS